MLTNPAVPEPLYAASVCASIAALCGNSSIVSVTPGYVRESLFGCGASNSVVFPDGVQQFASGGYTVIREAICGRRVHLVFDHGPLGYLKLAAHGHADALAIWLSVDDVPVFADAGTWLYHSGETMRQTIRRSQFHNTLSLPGLSQSVPSAAFSWRNKAHAQLDGESALRDGDWQIAGKHDGYLKRKGVMHHRAIERRLDGFVVKDALKGPGAPLPVELSFLCGTGVEAEWIDDKVRLSMNNDARDAISVWLTAPAGFQVAIYDGDLHPDFAFVGDGFGRRSKACRIVLKGIAGEEPVETRIQLSGH